MDLGLSKRGEYVVRSAIALARAYPSSKPLKLRQVSEAMGVPRTFVSQILGDLVHAGLAVSSFGVRGGYRLARPPEEVNLLDVVEAGEGPLAVAHCGLEHSCSREDCPLLDTFSAATSRVRSTLTATTLADLMPGEWSAEGGLPCPAGWVEDDSDAAPGPGWPEAALAASTRLWTTEARSDVGRSSEDVVKDAIELLGERISVADGGGPDRDHGEDDHVDDHDDQRGRREHTQRDQERSDHDPSVAPSTVPAEPGGLGTAGPRSHGADSSGPSVPRDFSEEADRGPAEGPSSRPAGRQGGHAPITAVIVDDHVLVREGSVQLLEAEPDIEVVGVAGTGEEGIDLVERLCPDVALVDINLPGMSGLELARQARDRQLTTRVLIVSAYDDYGYVTEALQVGVGGYLLKTASAQELVDSLRLVVDGVMVLDRGVSARLQHRLHSAATAQPESGSLLTPRELDVLRLLADGRSNKEIAAELFLGLRTIESHVSSVLSKLGATSRTQAVALAMRQGLVAPSDQRASSSQGGPVARR